MSVERLSRGSNVVWRVRWREGGRGSRQRSRTFDRKADALTFDAELRRRRQAGGLFRVDVGRETLDQYVTETWARSHTSHLAPKTRGHYTWLYDVHISPALGSLRLSDLTPEVISRWQAERILAGAGRSAIRQALELLGSMLQRAVESERLPTNPVRLVRKPPKQRRAEVRPLAPLLVERMRAATAARDAALMSVLAYAGLRPGEAVALTWADVRERTLLVERAASLGEESDTKTHAHRTVRLLAPLAADLREYRLASGRPAERTLLFPRSDGALFTKTDWDNWRARQFARALEAADVGHARPYDLRHSFASLLLHEGRSVIYVARQLGHDARLTLTTYGHVIDELEDQPRVDAEQAIADARQALRQVA